MKDLGTSQFQYVQEVVEFLKLFPHRYDYIWAEHTSNGKKTEWRTESRHPLSDRLINQGAALYGVRFGAETKYCLLDIDAGSQYHPSRDPLALSRIVEVLEPLGLVSFVSCTSSYSGGIHLYFPFEQPQKTWKLAVILRTLLENAGFTIALGQLELFPNTKTFVTDGRPSFYAAHRLPLQIGSYLLDDEGQPTYTSRSKFVERWQFAQKRNAVETQTLEQLLRSARRQQYGLSGKADKFLNDLNAEIETGWTDHGQTNYLLGRIAMRSYVFGHILYAPQPLEGKALISDIVRVATSLPGYQQWCRHQHEIEKRAEEWARSVESSHYFHYSRRRIVKAPPSPSWNEQQRQQARERIASAIADLLEKGSLPAAATARCHALTAYGIGGGSLYRHRDLWHPAHLQPVENPPDPPASNNCSGWESIGDAPQPLDSPSLLESVGGNVPPANDFSTIASSQNESSGRNSLSVSQISDCPVVNNSQPAANQSLKNTPQWIQTLLFELKNARINPQPASALPLKGITGERVIAQQQGYEEQMKRYLESGDPILIREALQALKLTV